VLYNISNNGCRNGGSKYGGLKQIEPIDENENFIVDYSIFDAIKYDFDKVVFIKECVQNFVHTHRNTQI